MGLKSILRSLGEKSEEVNPGEIYKIKPECLDDVPKAHFKTRKGKTLSPRRWRASFSEDGHLDFAKVLKRIQDGGVHPSIKGEVWEFLLGCFDPHSTFDDRTQLRQRRREQYGKWKAECQEMVPAFGKGRIILARDATTTPSERNFLVHEAHADDDTPHKNVTRWKNILHQIGLDVVRTDRTLVFYESEINQAKLWDILAVYAWIDGDIGYCQGMSDICSPMVLLLENEADAFWCFERAMRKLRENFRSNSSSIGVQSQLRVLSDIIKTIDPMLHRHIEDLDGGQYLFAFRMLMVIFRREFSFVDSLYLWELMWAMEYNPNTFALYEKSYDANFPSPAAEVNNKILKQCGKFERRSVKYGFLDNQRSLAVFLAASVLETSSKRLIKETQGLDDIVKILANIMGNLDAKKACKGALKIQRKYLKMKKS